MLFSSALDGIVSSAPTNYQSTLQSTGVQVMHAMVVLVVNHLVTGNLQLEIWFSGTVLLTYKSLHQSDVLLYASHHELVIVSAHLLL